MPFTLSHVLAIVPFYKYLRKYFSISGLIMGSMAPDFEFFLRITLYGIWGHTFKGIFFFDFPISIILILVFHIWVRDALIVFLPDAISIKYAKFYKFDWVKYFKNNFHIVGYSVLLGIFTHFVWDNITHEPNYVSPFYFQFLEKKLKLFVFTLPVYSILQIISSIIGLAWLLWFFLLETNILTLFNGFSKKWKFWFYTFFVTSTIFFCRYLIGVPTEKPFGQIVVVFIGSFIYGLILVSVFYPKPNEVNF